MCIHVQMVNIELEPQREHRTPCESQFRKHLETILRYLAQVSKNDGETAFHSPFPNKNCQIFVGAYFIFTQLLTSNISLDSLITWMSIQKSWKIRGFPKMGGVPNKNQGETDYIFIYI